MTRREVLSAGVAATLLGPSFVQAEEPGPIQRERALRFAHLTDVHVQPERGAGEGMAACLKHVQEQKDAPEFIVFGGDNIMNVDDADGCARAEQQVNLWRSVLKQECSLPYTCAIGNHDVYMNHPVDGKKWAVDTYELPGKQYTVDRAGWRFIVLDSTFPEGEKYRARFDDEQHEWLAGTLKQTPEGMPVCVVSHMPILAVCTYEAADAPTDLWQFRTAYMHLDSMRLQGLFKEHPNVKLCLSGHMHMIDSVQYRGVTYACNGAVSGGWWKGAHNDFEPSYALVDLYKDGACDVQLVKYGWTAKA
jgi:3',5'-cyclic AMP phosphodiesterase CpdA